MGKKTKVGKKRKDKFYHLAKETGYRARSAFKLIQLNRKFGFLEQSRVLIDLCAAPGGWLQVAANFMPVSSVILGIDLVAIKPIKNVTTLQADITTDHCRQLIKKELKTWKADVVLNDGAPNVGSAWVQDAFSQAQLALSALKLASDHLRKDGWFITKVFRSKDYTALLWVLQQLFKKVHSTKPQASRSESAEIFVVCQGYLAPDKLDEKFLDPKDVFKEIQEDTKIRLNILRPEKHIRQREGYPENNITLHTSITAKQFIEASDPVDLLSTSNKIDIIDDEIKSHKLTTSEIKECCNDIKVLGRSELKLLFNWRKKIRKELKLDQTEKPPTVTEIEEKKTEEEQQLEIQDMINDLKNEEMRELKKKKKRIREQKKKLQERLANKLSGASGESGEHEQDLFSLNIIKNKDELKTVDEEEEPDIDEENLEEDDSENESEESDDSATDEEYIYGDDELYEKPEKKMKIDNSAKEAQTKSKNVRFQEPSSNPLLVDMSENEATDETAMVVNKAKQWFQKGIFKNIEDKADDDLDDEYNIDDYMMSSKREEKDKAIKKGSNHIEQEDDDAVKNHKEDSNGIANGDHIDPESEEDSDTGDDSDTDDRSISQGKSKKFDDKENKKKNGFDIVPQGSQRRSMSQKDKKGDSGTGYLSPEALALGTAMVTSMKRRRDIIDDSYNRYTFNDENLPSWFVEDEAKHTARQIPVTKEEVQFYKDRMREINARPIKKVIEAKAKKKSKMLKKLDRARKKAQGILDAADTSNKEKQDQIKSIYKRAGLLAKKKPETTYVVAKKGLAGKKYKRPASVKGPYKVVDPRMKKDLRAMKSKERTKGRGKRKKGRR